MIDKKAIFLRVLLISSLITLAAMAIFIHLLRVQSEMTESLGQNDPVLALREIPSPRGNIYDLKGNLLATSMPVYTIAIDATQPSDTLFNNNYKKLAKGLAAIFKDESKEQLEKKIYQSRLAKKQYFKLKSGVRYSELQEVKKLPILNKGRFKGGFVYTQQTSRTKPFKYLCGRTIGYINGTYGVGIEKSFDKYLKGENGLQMMQKIKGGVWKPLSNSEDVEPESGADIYSTIDIRIQDIAQSALLSSLEEYEAESGSVILMDVKTGAIRAMSSLQRTDEEKYAENFNFAFGAAYEPGSTFKLASLLVALEDGKIDTSSIVDTKNGVFEFYDRKMRDSNAHRGGHGKISIARAFEVSSNIGIARTIVDLYEDKPQEFIDRLARLGVSNKLDFELLGEAEPWIKNSNDSTWSGVSLPWISYGYELKMSALQILALYNAVANDGELVKPYLVDRIQRGEQIVTSKKVEVLKPSICSQNTISILKDLLVGVVKNGTAKNIYSKMYSCAGKTGTAKIASDGSYSSDYRASFAGYFPADNPKYSCIVVVTKPKKELGFYGNIVAAPVFKEIRNSLYAEEPVSVPLNESAMATSDKGLSFELNQIYKELKHPLYQSSPNNLWLNASNTGFKPLSIEDGVMPNLHGMSSMDAVYLLENLGLSVAVFGKGKVAHQSLKTGQFFKDNQKVTLSLL
ncbi:MAG: penicillin-binding protein [Flavobacteriales bacterium]|nr:penicillin-binding protein [Flavobacteriales bacterium]MDG1395843.1 penicillin-binding protein [Flavobacteriales bacterium]